MFPCPWIQHLGTRVLTRESMLQRVKVICHTINPLWTPFSFTGSGRASGTIGSPLAGKLFVVIGAGGAGKALAYGAKEKGARVVIANRTYG